ncbi:MAG: helix-turn-helix domain-containing protein [Natrialbaceae archaeon]|nr:helix-turn-helix domain-containing protein [Natrialbaceae archaeon]
MSQSSAVVSQAHSATGTSTHSIDAEQPIQELLTVLTDADCRTILRHTSDEALSAGELTEECEIPSSTIYRKLDRLTDTGLLTERVRIREAGKHTSEYERTVTDVSVSISLEGEMELAVSLER